jgi:hypothetical protein
MAEGEARILGEFTDYDGMLTAVRTRVAELNVNGERFDEYAGLPKGYLSKLIGVKPTRRIAMTSMGPLFGALGIYCVVIENPDATARLRDRLPPRNGSYVRSVAVHGHLTTRFLRKIGAKGGENSRKYLGKRLRKQLARHAAAARWKKGP